MKSSTFGLRLIPLFFLLTANCSHKNYRNRSQHCWSPALLTTLWGWCLTQLVDKIKDISTEVHVSYDKRFRSYSFQKQYGQKFSFNYSSHKEIRILANYTANKLTSIFFFSREHVAIIVVMQFPPRLKHKDYNRYKNKKNLARHAYREVKCFLLLNFHSTF